jgi:ribosome-associated toxin RatA of RatAB toxin-antitoxin module
MPTIQRSALVLHSPDQIFDLVNDIEAYPQFLPWCKSSKIITKSGDKVTASLAISKAGLNHTFTTENTNIQGESIKIKLVDGPFNHLEGFWQFKPIGNNDGTKIQLDMDFEITNRVLAAALGPVFTQISGSLVDAFCKRAQEIYGN